MKVLDVFYYYYFLFYRKVIRDPEPHFATVLALSFSESLLLNGSMDIIALKYYCYEVKVIVQFSITILIILINYLFYHRSGRVHNIINAKPTIAGSKWLSIAITVLFFLITTSWLFWGPIYGKHLLEQCK